MQNYLNVTVGNTDYNLTKSEKIQFTDTMVPRTGKAAGLPQSLWK